MELYIILAIIAMLLYGVTAIIYKLASPNIDSISLTLFTSIFMTIVIFIFWLFSKQKQITIKGLEYAGIGGLIAGFAFIAFVTSIGLGRVSITTTLRGLSFAVTVGIAILFLSEQITLMKLIGIGFAIIAIILLSI